MRCVVPMAWVGLALLGCTNSAPPPLDTSNLPPVQKSQDWKDWGREENQARRVQGTKLTGEQIQGRLVGRVLSGCYANGQLFSEIMADNGEVRDPRDGSTLARYQVQGDRLCFAYPNRPVACYNVSTDQRGLYFYTAGGYRLAASTACPIPKDTRGLN